MWPGRRVNGFGDHKWQFEIKQRLVVDNFCGGILIDYFYYQSLDRPTDRSTDRSGGLLLVANTDRTFARHEMMYVIFFGHSVIHLFNGTWDQRRMCDLSIFLPFVSNHPQISWMVEFKVWVTCDMRHAKRTHTHKWPEFLTPLFTIGTHIHHRRNTRTRSHQLKFEVRRERLIATA